MKHSVVKGKLQIGAYSNALVAIKMHQATSYLQIQLIMPVFQQHPVIWEHFQIVKSTNANHSHRLI